MEMLRATLGNVRCISITLCLFLYYTRQLIYSSPGQHTLKLYTQPSKHNADVFGCLVACVAVTSNVSLRHSDPLCYVVPSLSQVKEADVTKAPPTDPIELVSGIVGLIFVGQTSLVILV